MPHGMKNEMKQNKNNESEENEVTMNEHGEI
jgi:hypothetical protein